MERRRLSTDPAHRVCVQHNGGRVGSDPTLRVLSCVAVVAVGKVTSVSSLWTPSGEHQPSGDPEPSHVGAPPGPGREPTPEEVAEVEAEMRRAREELASVPVADIIANHAVGLWQLAVLHLTPDPEPDGSGGQPRLAEAGLAIDALSALVDGLGERLAPHDEALLEAVTQLRLAYVQVSTPER